MRLWILIPYCLFSCGILVASLLGLLFFPPLNRCDMTYMWMYPEFIDVFLPKHVQDKYPSYKLFLYGEGYYAHHIRSLKLEGIPVLFIPGNAGSGKQVRSLASVSLNKTEKDYAKRNRFVEFNYFSVDFDEELSALYGEFLWKQTNYVILCIRKIFSLYEGQANPPTQIVLIGHSMGGLVARSIFAAPGFNASVVSVLITLATPHTAPVAKFDPVFLTFNDRVNKWWEEEGQRSLVHLAVMSIGGGPSDILVPSFLTSWPQSLSHAIRNHAHPRLPKFQLYERSTSSMDWVWAGADHLCIVWCNQLVVAIVRSLFEMVPEPGSRVTENVYRRREALDFHLLRNPGAKSLRKALTFRNQRVAFGAVKEFRYFNPKGAQLYTTSPRSLPTILYKLFISESLVGSSVFLLTNQKVDSVAHFCSGDEGCDEGDVVGIHHLAPPSSRFLHLTLDEGMLGKTLVAPMYYHSPKRVLVFALYNHTGDDHRRVLPLHLLRSFVPFWGERIHVDGSLGFLNVTLNGMHSLFQVYSVALVPTQCSVHAKEQIAGVYFTVMGSPTQSLYRTFSYPYKSSEDLWVRLQIPDSVKDSWPTLHLLLNPGCQYSLRIDPSLVQSFGQVIRHFGSFLPGICVFQLLLLLFISNLF